MRCFSLLSCFVMIAVATDGVAGQGPKLRLVKYGGLKQAILEQRGRVVLVNFWGTFCPPCKKKFPHWTELQSQLGHDRFVVITVSLDKAGQQDRAAGFAAKHGETYCNLLLDEPGSVFEEKLRVSTVPCYYVFDQQGRWTQFGGDAGAFDYKDVDALIRSLVKGK